MKHIFTSLMLLVISFSLSAQHGKVIDRIIEIGHNRQPDHGPS